MNILKKCFGGFLMFFGLVLMGTPIKTTDGNNSFIGIAMGIAVIWFGWRLIRGKKKKSSKKEKMLAKYAKFNKEDFDKEVEHVENADIKTKAATVGKIIRWCLTDGILDRDEEAYLDEVTTKLGITMDDIPVADQRLLGEGLVIRDLLEGNVKPRVNAANIPFKILKSEVLVWVFQSVHLSEIKTVKEWQGGAQGVSVRVARGVYWHFGKSRGHRVEHQVLKDLGSGMVGVTSKHLYFITGNLESMRIKHDKIVSILPDSKGAVIYREGARSNPLFFECDDPWFFVNVVQNASNWDK